MSGGSVYKDHTFNKETAHLTKTAQYIARIFTVQYKYMNVTKHKKQKIQKAYNTRKKHEYIKKPYMKNTRKYEEYTENTNILPGKEPGP
jgi:hypothetical protein